MPDAATVLAAQDALVGAADEILAAALPASLEGGLAAIAVRSGADVSKALSAAAAALGDSRAARWIVAVDEEVELDRFEPVLFRWVSNADPTRDCRVIGPRLCCDATRKTPGEHGGRPIRDYPPIVSMDEEVAADVERRFAASLGLDPRVAWPARER